MSHLSKRPYLSLEMHKKLLNALCELYNSRNTQQIVIYIVGGSALQLKYGDELRDLTFDGDGWWIGDVDLKPYIKETAKRFHVYEDWLNDDFRGSMSFSKHIVTDAIHMTIIGLVSIFVVSDLTQLCMKLTSMRRKDSDDAIALAYKLRDASISMVEVNTRLLQLYNGKVNINKTSLKRIERILRRG